MEGQTDIRRTLITAVLQHSLSVPLASLSALIIMHCLKVLLLAGLATGRAVSPRASDTFGPDSLGNSSTIALAGPLVPRDNLPANVPSDFWTRKDPPSSLAQPDDNLRFEILYCSGEWE